MDLHEWMDLSVDYGNRIDDDLLMVDLMDWLVHYQENNEIYEVEW